MLGQENLNGWQAAEALHWAVYALRDRTRAVEGIKKVVSSDPLVWAPYIQIGV